MVELERQQVDVAIELLVVARAVDPLVVHGAAETIAVDADVVGHGAVKAALRVTLNIGLQQQRRVVGEIEADLRHDGEAFAFDHVVLGVAGLATHRHAVVAQVGIRERAGEVDARAVGAEAAAIDPHQPLLLGLRLLADVIDEPARLRTPVKGRQGTLDHVDTLQKERVDLDIGERTGIVGQPQAVEKGVVDVAAGKAAQRDRGLPRRGPGKAGEHAGRIAQRVVDRARALILDLLARYDIDGQRRLNEWRVGLGRGARRVGGITGRRRVRAVDRFTLHHQRRQRLRTEPAVVLL